MNRDAKPIVQLNTWLERHEASKADLEGSVGDRAKMSAVVTLNRVYFEKAIKYGRKDDDASAHHQHSHHLQSQWHQTENNVGGEDSSSQWLATDSSRVNAAHSYYYGEEQPSASSSASASKTSAIEKVRSNETVSHPENVVVLLVDSEVTNNNDIDKDMNNDDCKDDSTESGLMRSDHLEMRPKFSFGDGFVPSNTMIAIPRAQVMVKKKKLVSKTMTESNSVYSSDDNDSGVSFLVPRSLPTSANKKPSTTTHLPVTKRSEAQSHLMKAIRDANGLQGLRKTNGRCF